MMRALVWVLLLGNVIFFAVMQSDGLLISGDQSMRALPPLHPEKIILLGAPPDKPAAALSAPAGVAPEPASAAENAQPLPAALPEALCMEWGEFSGADLERATTALSALQLGDKLSRRQVEYAIGYWVYLPPQRDKAAVNQKIAQLKARGIEEYFVVPDPGPWLNAISLGVFRTKEAAQHFLDVLQRTKDVRTAEVGERASKLKASIFVLNGLDTDTAARIAAIQKDFAGSDLKDIPCANP